MVKARVISELHNEEDIVKVKDLEGEADNLSVSNLKVKDRTINALYLHSIPIRIGDGDKYNVKLILSSDVPFTQVTDELKSLIKGKTAVGSGGTSVVIFMGNNKIAFADEIIDNVHTLSSFIVYANEFLSIAEEYYPIPIMELEN